MRTLKKRLVSSLSAILAVSSSPVLSQPGVIWQRSDSQAEATTVSPPITWKKISEASQSQASGVQWNQIHEESAQTPHPISFSDINTPESDNEEIKESIPTTDPKQPSAKPANLPPYTWPNGQPMSPEDKIFYSTAFSRGSLIQIGDTIYPNLGFNALQRQPNSWGNIAIAAIDNSFQGTNWASLCSRGDFTSFCADGLAEIYARLWNSKAFSLDLQWTIHSLSGGAVDIAGRTGGTEFGEGQSLGFKLSKNLTPTFGLTFGANRLIHLDLTTDLPKNLYLMGTKIIRVNDSATSPIFSVSLGVMSDVYNPNTNIGSVQYPQWLLGGEYPSLFAEYFDKRQSSSGRGYYPNVAGVTSAFVCANQSIFAFKPLTAANPNCIKQVYVGPVGSIGFAPWPWLGFYAIYEGNLNLGVSVKPFKEVPWNISIQAVQPFTGINPRDDAYISEFPCAGRDLQTCRTRVGVFMDLAF
jgi:hypothetical protein